MELITFTVLFFVILVLITFMWVAIVMCINWKILNIKQALRFILDNFVMYMVVILQSITITIMLSNFKGW